MKFLPKKVNNTLIEAPLYTRSQDPKKLGANFEHFWLVVWHQVITNK
jgi:hypothetical protein